MANTDGNRGNTAVQTRPSRAMTSWDPFDIFDELEQRMAQAWNQFRPWFMPMQGQMTQDTGSTTRGISWLPSMDVFEQDGKLTVKVDLPGVKQDDVSVEIDQGSLVIKGKRQSEQEVRRENYYRMERSSGSFYRRLPLPEGIKPDDIKASFKDGVLEVQLPKPTEKEPSRQQIPITTS
jgi:HSP20 family protein